MEEELERAKELLTIQANMGHNDQIETEPVELERTLEKALGKAVEPMASIALEKEWE